jgi:hypothetical protein
MFGLPFVSVRMPLALKAEGFFFVLPQIVKYGSCAND